MKVTCPNCAAKYKVKDELIPSKGAKISCPKCKSQFMVKPEAAQPPDVPAFPSEDNPFEALPPKPEAAQNKAGRTMLFTGDDPFAAAPPPIPKAPPKDVFDDDFFNNPASFGDEDERAPSLAELDSPKSIDFGEDPAWGMESKPSAGAKKKPDEKHNLSLMMVPPPEALDFKNEFDADMDMEISAKMKGGDARPNLPSESSFEKSFKSSLNPKMSQEPQDIFGDDDFKVSLSDDQGGAEPKEQKKRFKTIQDVGMQGLDAKAEKSDGKGDFDFDMDAEKTISERPKMPTGTNLSFTQFFKPVDDDGKPVSSSGERLSDEGAPGEPRQDLQDLFKDPTQLVAQPGGGAKPAEKGGEDLSFDLFSFKEPAPTQDAYNADTLVTKPQSAGRADFDFSKSDFLDQIVDLSSGDDKIKLFKIKQKSGKVFGPFPLSTIADMYKSGKIFSDDEVAGEDGKWKPLSAEPEIKSIISRDGAPAARPEPSALGVEVKDGRLPDKKSRKQSVTGIFEPKVASRGTLRRRLPVIIAVSGAALILVVIELYLQLFGDSSLLEIIMPADKKVLHSYAALNESRKKLYDRAEQTMLMDLFPKAVETEKKLDAELQENNEFKGRYSLVGIDATIKMFIALRYGFDNQRVKRSDDLMKSIIEGGEDIRSVLLAKGLIAMQKKELEEARKFFQRALQTSVTKWDALAVHMLAWTFLDGNPSSYLQGQKQLAPFLQAGGKAYPFTYFLMGRLSEASGNREEARGFYQKALEASPDHQESALMMILLDVENPKNQLECEEKLLTLIQNSKNSNLAPSQLAKAYFVLSRIYLKRNELIKVSQRLSEAIKTDPANTEYINAMGDFFFQTHEYQKSFEEYEKCLKINPKDVGCNTGSAKALLARGKPDEALLKLQDAAKLLGENNDKLNYTVALILENQKMTDKAIKYFEKAIAFNPKEILYYTKLAEIYLRKDNMVRANELAQKAKDINADSPIAHNFLGKLYMYKKDYDLALAEFKVAIENDASFVEGYINLGDAYRIMQKHNDAVETLNKAILLDDKSASAHYTLGQVYLEMENFEKAASELELAVRFSPRSPLYHLALGQAYFAMKRDNDAAAAVQKEIEIQYEYAPAFFLLGQIYSDMGKNEEAIAAYERSIQLNGQNPYFHFFLGRHFYKLGREKSAIDHLDVTINLKPDYSDAYLFKGLCLINIHQYQQSINVLDKALKLNPKMIPALMARAEANRFFKKNKMAEKDYQSVLKLDGKNSLANLYLGDIYVDMGLDKKALQHLLRAKELDPTLAEVYNKIGYIQKKLRNNGAALSAFKTYLELKPNAIDANEIRNEIELLSGRR